MGTDGNVYNSSGERVLMIDDSNVIGNSSDGNHQIQSNVHSSCDSANGGVLDDNKRVEKPADEPTLADVFRIQTATVYKMAKMRIDIDNMFQFLKRLDSKMDLLLNGGFGGSSAFAQHDVVPPAAVIIRKSMESVNEFERFEEDLKSSDFQEENVCYLSRESLWKHIFHTYICPFFTDRCTAISIRESWKS